MRRRRTRRKRREGTVSLHQEVGGVWLLQPLPLLRSTLGLRLLEVHSVSVRGCSTAAKQLAGTHDVGVDPQPQAGLHKGVWRTHRHTGEG